MSGFVALGAVLALLSVGLGAFGAHGLRGRLTAEDLERFRTGVQYQGMHSLGMVLVGVLATLHPATAWKVAGWLFVVGIVVFSGSLYALALSGRRRLGAITPIGGLAFLVGWAALALGALSIRGL